MIKYLLWLVITWMALKRNAVIGPVLLIFNFLWNRFISGCNFSFWWKHFHNSAFWVIQHFSKCPLSHWAWVKLNLWEIPCRNRKISESKPFKCSCHSYPCEALERIFLFTNVPESRPFILVQNYRYGCFTLFRCANNARNWHLVGSHCLNISSQRQKRAPQKSSQSRPADGLCGSAIVKESHLHPGQDKKFRKVGSWRCKPTNWHSSSVLSACRQPTETASASDCLRTTSTPDICQFYTHFEAQNFYTKST